jgi:UDP-N-acetylmuramoyl-L-alanyl-D-glutamate--2,6-diaminopimelate ligase
MTKTPSRTAGLDTLVAALDGAAVRGALDLRVSGLAHDSRTVAPGNAFVALRGTTSDGHDFVPQAVARGATALVVELARAERLDVPPGVTVVAVPDTQAALARLAATFFDRPARAFAHLIGITGTNGKTTTSLFIQAVLEAGGYPCGRIGTLGAHFGETEWHLGNTTPLALELQASLAKMRDLGARAVVMEVSSHALALGRVADIEFTRAVLTNVTRDHLDFHKTFDTYVAEKRKLFDLASAAIFNLDDRYGRIWAGDFPAGPWQTYGFAPDARVRAQSVVLLPGGSAFSVDGNRFELRVPGRFNVSNALAAIATGRSVDIDDARTARSLASIERIPGRMEHFGAGGVDVVVDYAHTPDALENVLGAVRATTAGRLTVVFGCGGDRDRGKRPEMGRVASELADRVVVTSDNPRSEDPQTIVAEILAGVRAGVTPDVELDRAAAIERAIAEATSGDAVVVAGKGHETEQIVGATSRHFDDREIVQAALHVRERA